MCSSVLQCVLQGVTVLQGVAGWCSDKKKLISICLVHPIIATHCNTLQYCVSVCCIVFCRVLQWQEEIDIYISCPPYHCNTLQPTVVVCSSTATHTVVVCSSLLRCVLHGVAVTTKKGTYMSSPAKRGHLVSHCSTLQHAATLCNTLHHTAPHCTKMQQEMVWGGYGS